MEKAVFKNNPIKFSSKKSEALDHAFEIFIDAFEEYVEKNQLSDQEIRYLTKLINEIYLEKKTSDYLNEKLSFINNNFNHLLQNLLSREKADNVPVSVFYYNLKNHLKENEQN